MLWHSDHQNYSFGKNHPFIRTTFILDNRFQLWIKYHIYDFGMISNKQVWFGDFNKPHMHDPLSNYPFNKFSCICGLFPVAPQAFHIVIPTNEQRTKYCRPSQRLLSFRPKALSVIIAIKNCAFGLFSHCSNNRGCDALGNITKHFYIITLRENPHRFARREIVISVGVGRRFECVRWQ